MPQFVTRSHGVIVASIATQESAKLVLCDGVKGSNSMLISLTEPPPSIVCLESEL